MYTREIMQLFRGFSVYITMWKTLWIMWITNRRIIMREILCKFVGEGRMLVWRRKRAEKVSFFSCDFDERCERMGEKGQRKGKIFAKDGA